MDSAQRFAFGRNWQSFLQSFSEQRLESAAASMALLLKRDRLDGLHFLDAGSGSGLFSAAAFSLGAQVVSFDYDPNSVEATNSLRPAEASDRWRVCQGSLLDERFMGALEDFDVVYCWGVAHHTGDMWRALDLVSRTVRPGGSLITSIYNDQGTESRVWAWIKRQYNARPWMKPALVAYTWLRLWAVKSLFDIVRLRPFHSWKSNAGDTRGMTAWHHLVDWAGGYPFEVATPDAILAFFRVRGFVLDKLVTRGGGHGCNEFVFRKIETVA